MNGSTETRFLYEGDQIIGEYNASNQLLRRYVPGPGDEVASWYEGAGTSDRRYLVTDRQGSVISVTNAAGTVLGINSYDEAGIGAAGNLGRFQYDGEPWLSEIGLYNLQARAYSPYMGRFMQTDPIQYEGGANWYAYGASDPVNSSDPSGLLPNGHGGDDCFMDCEGGPIVGGEQVEPPPPGVGHNGGPPLVEAATAGSRAGPLGAVLGAAAVALTGDTPSPPRGVEPVPGDQSSGATDNAIRNHLKSSDLAAARLELKGEVVATKGNGVPFDHVQEVNEARAVLQNRVQYVKRVLSNPNITPGQRFFYQRELSQASSALDYSRGFLK